MSRWRRHSAIRCIREHVYNPAADRKERPDNPYAQSRRRAFPLRAVHLSPDRASHRRRNVAQLSHLAELQPELFCEVSPELAAEIGLEHGDWATITTPRAMIEARVLVTQRMRPLWVEGRTVHQVGLPYHWGYNGMVTGDSVNDLLVDIRGAQRAHHGNQGAGLRHRARPPRSAGLRRLKQLKEHMEQPA